MIAYSAFHSALEDLSGAAALLSVISPGREEGFRVISQLKLFFLAWIRAVEDYSEERSNASDRRLKKWTNVVVDGDERDLG